MIVNYIILIKILLIINDVKEGKTLEIFKLNRQFVESNHVSKSFEYI